MRLREVIWQSMRSFVCEAERGNLAELEKLYVSEAERGNLDEHEKLCVGEAERGNLDEYEKHCVRELREVISLSMRCFAWMRLREII